MSVSNNGRVADEPPGRIDTQPSLHVVLGLEETPRADIHAASAVDRERLRLWLSRTGRRDALELLLGDDEWAALFDDCGDVGETVVRGGLYRGKTFFEVAELGVEGQRWFATMLARLGADDWMRVVVEAFVRERLPELWARYAAWLREGVTA